MKKIPKLTFRLKRLVDSLFVGNYATAFKGKGLEFSDYRNYEFGDDAKNIDFLASEKEQKPLIKRFEEQRELRVYFIIDASFSMNFSYKSTPKIQTLKEVFLRLGWTAHKNNDQVGAFIFGGEKQFFSQAKKGYKNLEFLSGKIDEIHSSTSQNKKKNTEKSLSEMIYFFNTLPIKNSLVFVLSDKTENIDERNLKILGIKNETIFINIFDHFENNLSHDGGIIKLGKEKKTFFVNLYLRKKIEKYKKLRATKIKDFSKKLSRFSIGYLQIDNYDNILSKIMIFFKQR